VAAGSDTPTRFSSPSTPPMTLPNGIELVGTDLYVADSNGFIFKVDSSETRTDRAVVEIRDVEHCACRWAIPSAPNGRGSAAGLVNTPF